MEEQREELASAEQLLQPRPLSANKFASFFQRIWRWWQGVWCAFSQKHPKLSAWAYKIAFFLVFSIGVTVLQYIGFIALPHAFGLELAGTEFMWPHIKLATIDGNDIYWNILGYNVSYDSAGNVIIGGGLGYFLAYEITVFLAQCINFPLQRNITFRSHGNPWWQAMWYFIGWILVSVFCNAINGLWIPFAELYVPGAVYNILVTVVTGGVSMAIFFFIFLIIFPDVVKTEASAKRRLESAEKSLEEAGARGGEALAAAKKRYNKAALAYEEALENKKVFESEKAIRSANSLAEAKINGYCALNKKLCAARAEAESAEGEKKTRLCAEIAELEEASAKMRAEAIDAAISRNETVPINEKIIEEVKAARAARRAAEKKN